MIKLSKIQAEALNSARQSIAGSTRCGLILRGRDIWVGAGNRTFTANTVRSLEKKGLLKVDDVIGVAEITEAGIQRIIENLEKPIEI